MVQETRHISALDVNLNVTWSNESNAFVEDDNYADSSDIIAIGDHGGGNYQDITQTPDSLDLFQVRFLDIGTEHADDTFTLDVYNPHTSSWETLETFDSGNKLPSALTTKDYTVAMQGKFASAADKSAFLNGLQLRFYMSAKSKGADRPNIGLAWSKFTYSYTEISEVLLQGVSEGQSSVSGDTKATKKVIGDLTGISNLSVQTSVLMKVSGSSIGESGISGLGKATRKVVGDLDGVSGLSNVPPHVTRKVIGTSDGASVLNGAVKTTRKMLGVIDGSTSLAGSAKVTKKMGAGADAISSLSAMLLIEGADILLQGTIVGESDLTGIEKVMRRIAGGSNGVSSVLDVPPHIIRRVDGALGGSSGLSGIVEVDRKMLGAIGGVASISGLIGRMLKIGSSIDATAALSGTLSIEGGLTGLQGVVQGASNVRGNVILVVTEQTRTSGRRM